MTGFVNHHVHSHFSSLDGMPSPMDIAQRIAELGQESFSITDHGTLAGIPQAYRAAKKFDLGFTPGCEVYFTKDRTIKSKDRLGEKYYHTILLAQNEQGYKNLVKMQTPAWEEGYYHKPRVDYHVLEQYHEGLVVTTACLGSLTNQLLLRDNYKEALRELGTLVDIFGKENVYVELQRHGIGEQEKILYQQAQLAKDMGLPMLATCDSHYCCPEDHDFHDSLLCTATKSKKSDEKRFRFENSNFYLHSGEEMLAKFPEHEFPGAVSNTVELARRSNFTMKIDEDKEYIMPKVHTKEGLSQSETLREHVYIGAASPERYGDAEGNIPIHVKERIDYELGVVEKMGFSGYFLIVERLVKLFADNGIFVGAGRGSAAGSALVYCLGITKVDPFAHNLFFERFLNPDRISMPDIDIDIPQTKRQQALRLIEQEYGEGHVAHLSNYTVMAMRESLQRMGKVFGLDPGASNNFTKEVAAYCEEKEIKFKDFALQPVPHNILQKVGVDGETAQKIVKAAARLEGTLISYGVHASGIVVTDTPVDDNFPVRISKNAPLPVCQYDGTDIESLGGVKLDMLGLVNLDQCEEAERNILLDLGESVDSSKLSLDDPEVYKTLGQARSGGVFQLGSSGMKKLLKNMAPTEFSDIVASLALFRPGPMGMGTHDEYCLRKNSHEDFDVLHEDLRELLSDTYGLTVYQEDIMSQAKIFGGYTGAEADELRKAVAKKNPEKMEQQRQKLIPAVNSRFGNNLGEKLWDIIEPFGAYAFCKAHSVAYAVTSYRTAWLKTHYPAQFAGAVLDHTLGVPEKRSATVAWIREENIIINPPDINSSELRTITSKDSITLPLDVINGVGFKKAEDIIKEREENGLYTSLVDFVSRNNIPQRMLIFMAKSGAFDSLGVSRASIIKNVDAIISLAKTQSGRKEVSEGLFGDFIDVEIKTNEAPDLKVEPDDIKLDGVIFPVDSSLYGAWEKESIGILLGDHPYAEYRKFLNMVPEASSLPKPVDSFLSPVEKTSFSGVITGIMNSTDRRGSKYSRFTIETDMGSITGMVYKNHIPIEKVDGKVVNFTGDITNDRDAMEGEFVPFAFCSNLRIVDMEKVRARFREFTEKQ